MREALVESPTLPERATEVAGKPPQATNPLQRWAERHSPRRVKVNTALRFYHEVLGLDHLHYGLWNGDPFTLEGFKVAQDRFSRHLQEWIPDGVRSVLDVGCGVGSTARMLCDAGYAVEGLSPDPYHREEFARRVGAPFHLARFQEFAPPYRYDLVLMSESAQYIWLDRLFAAVRATVAPDGYLLVADYFSVEDSAGPLAASGHPLEQFLAQAEASGLVVERREDITARVAPTLDLARTWMHSYVEPSLAVAADAFRARHPRLSRVGKWLFRRRLERFREQLRLPDGAEFMRHKRYLLLLFRAG